MSMRNEGLHRLRLQIQSRRSGSSPLKQIITALMLVAFAVFGASSALAASDGSDSVARAQALPTPAIHYTFDTDLLDVHSASTLTVAAACPADPCNATSSFGSDADGKYWTWSSTDYRGGGFTLLTSANIGTSYTIALKFSFSQVTSWRKIIDYEDRVSDNGFYYYSSKLQFYNGGQTFNSTTTYPANTVLDLVVVRESTNPSDPSVLTGTFTVYAVGADNSLTQLFQYSDTVGNSIPHVTSGGLTKLGFFFDDTATSSEATASGKVYDLRIWSGTSLNVQTLGEAVVRPSSVTNVAAVPTSQAIDVSWTAVSGATSYIATAGSQSCTVSAPATTCRITGLTDGSSYTVSVQAVGPGGYSNVASTASAVTVGAPSVTTTTVASTTTVPSSTTTVPSTSAEPNGTSATPAVGSELPVAGTSYSMTVVLLAVLHLALGVVLLNRSRAKNFLRQ